MSGRPVGSKKKMSNTQIGSCESMIDDETRRYGIKIKFHKAADTKLPNQLANHQHLETIFIHELQGNVITGDSIATAADTQPTHSLDFSDVSIIHENFLDELENIYLTSPTAVISSDVSLPLDVTLPSDVTLPAPSAPTKVASVVQGLKQTKLEFKLVSGFGNDPDTVPSQKGGAKLVFQGAYFNKDGQNKSKQTSYYRCDQNAVTNCKFRVIVKNGDKRSNGKMHNHECLTGKEEMLRWSQNLKEKAVSGVPAQNACTTQNLSEEAFAHVATAKAIRSKYYYIKNKETIKFPTVHDLTFELPEQYCWTDQTNPEWFLLKDTGKDDPERILAFSTKKMIKHFAKTKRTPGDGTFASVPKNSFFQLYSLHAQIAENTMAPAIFFLLPNKKMKTYERAFTIVKIAVEEEQETWSPNEIRVSEKDFLLDFEQGAIKALKKVFPNCKISLCYFHFCQSLKRAVQRGPYIQLIKENEDAKNIILMLRALPMIPTEHVVSVFELMCDLEWGDMSPIRDYFEKTYIGKWAQKRGPGGRPIYYRKKPLFPPELWNQFEQSRSGEARTTNSLEGQLLDMTTQKCGGCCLNFSLK